MIKSRFAFEFFGGATKEVEKRNTAAQLNALLASLRAAGLLAT